MSNVMKLNSHQVVFCGYLVLQQKVAFYILLIFYTLLNSIFATYLCKKASLHSDLLCAEVFPSCSVTGLSCIWELTPSSLKPFKSLTVWHCSIRFAMYYYGIGTPDSSIFSCLFCTYTWFPLEFRRWPPVRPHYQPCKGKFLRLADGRSAIPGRGPLGSCSQMEEVQTRIRKDTRNTLYGQPKFKPKSHFVIFLPFLTRLS